jgi:molybdate transport system ATP-binding protein
VIPGDGITVLESGLPNADEFGAIVTEARHLGEITLATLALDNVPGALLRLNFTGAQRLRITPGEKIGVRLDQGLVHVMPSRQE